MRNSISRIIYWYSDRRKTAFLLNEFTFRRLGFLFIYWFRFRRKIQIFIAFLRLICFYQPQLKHTNAKYILLCSRRSRNKVLINYAWCWFTIKLILARPVQEDKHHLDDQTKNVKKSSPPRVIYAAGLKHSSQNNCSWIVGKHMINLSRAERKCGSKNVCNAIVNIHNAMNTRKLLLDVFQTILEKMSNGCV